jgi:hypothetical protein
MEVMFDRVAGLDVGKESVTVCLRTSGPRGRRSETRTFKTTTGSLAVMRDWLVEAGVCIAAMESTSTYWKPPFYCLEEVAEHIRVHGIDRDELLFSTEVGTPISRNTFRTRVWLPAVEESGIDFGVRVHDLRHAHASWLLAGGADLKGVMDRMGYAQIQTTQKYLHTLPDTDQKNLDALTRMTGGSDRMS